MALHAKTDEKAPKSMKIRFWKKEHLLNLPTLGLYDFLIEPRSDFTFSFELELKRSFNRSSYF